MKNPDDYRKGVGILLLNDEGKVFVGQRIDKTSEAWQMPQGGIDDGETPHEALLRELSEEVGTTKAEVIFEVPEWLYYDLPEDLQKKLWRGRYKGQMQKWFALRFTGTDADINIATEIPEFAQWKWADISELPDLIVPFKRELYAEVLGKMASVFNNN